MKIFFTVFVILFSLSTPSFSVPLSTKSRWIVDDHTGKRVKLVGGNWAGHVSAMLPEGLDKLPVNEIAKHISLMGFNSVRLTYATYMFTKYSDMTVIQSLRNLSLFDAIDGMAKNNPQLLHLTLPDAQEAVVNELAVHGIMTVLDNQVSKPIWCCADDDGNGFWGDKYFDPYDWLESLHIVAHKYRNNPMVVGMSLRNELRGDKQNVKHWYHYVNQGVARIHKSNPNILILVSGLDYDLDFTPLKIKPLEVQKHKKMGRKIIYESHRYAFTMGQSKDYLKKPLNQFCDSVIKEMENRTTFLTKGPYAAPLYISEFGVNMLGNNTSDNVFLGCFLSYLSKYDLDWNLWALQGSYYFHDEKQGPSEEQYGMFSTNWTQIRNPDIHAKLLSVQQIIKDPSSTAPSYLRLYHPNTARCFSVNDKNEVLATDCRRFSKWSYENSMIQLKGSAYCLTATGEDMPVTLTTDCKSKQSTWKSVSTYQLANKDNLCIHYDPYYSQQILAKKCICPTSDEDSPCVENPQSQWVQLVSSNALE